MNERAFRTPFWMLSSGTRYSFKRAGRTVKGAHVSATMPIATALQILLCRSCTLKLFRRVERTSCGPIALAMKPNVLLAARRMPFLCAFSMSRSSKQILIHSLALTDSGPRSAILPTKSMVFSCTFSCLLRRMGVSRGSKSLMGGCMEATPTTETIDRSAESMLPSTSGYSSPRYSYRTTPSFAIKASSPQTRMTLAMREMRSAACCRTVADLLFSRQRIVDTICGR